MSREIGFELKEASRIVAPLSAFFSLGPPTSRITNSPSLVMTEDSLTVDSLAKKLYMDAWGKGWPYTSSGKISMEDIFKPGEEDRLLPNSFGDNDDRLNPADDLDDEDSKFPTEWEYTCLQKMNFVANACGGARVVVAQDVLVIRPEYLWLEKTIESGYLASANAVVVTGHPGTGSCPSQRGLMLIMPLMPCVLWQARLCFSCISSSPVSSAASPLSFSSRHPRLSSSTTVEGSPSPQIPSSTSRATWFSWSRTWTPSARRRPSGGHNHASSELPHRKPADGERGLGSLLRKSSSRPSRRRSR